MAGGAVDSWEQTLADLVAGSGAALKRHAFLLCGDEAHADDLVQEALVRAFTRPLRVPRYGGAAPSCAQAPTGHYFTAVVDAATLVPHEEGLSNTLPSVPLQSLGPVLNLGR